MQSRSPRARMLAVACACLVGAGPAWAETRLPLAEVLEVVRGEPLLVGQIEVEVRRRDLKASEIVCIAAQHGDQWRLLGGGRAAPYACTIGDRTLRIEAVRTYFDGNGHRLGQLGQAPDIVLFNRARYFREGNFRWTWSP